VAPRSHQEASNLSALHEREGVLYIDAEIANGILNLGVTQKDLDSA
jgi:hypothetical protein